MIVETDYYRYRLVPRAGERRRPLVSAAASGLAHLATWVGVLLLLNLSPEVLHLTISVAPGRSAADLRLSVAATAPLDDAEPDELREFAVSPPDRPLTRPVVPVVRVEPVVEPPADIESREPDNVPPQERPFEVMLKMVASDASAEPPSPASKKQTGAEPDRPLATLFNPAPNYPPDAVQDRRSGVVRVQIRVGTDGRVLRAILVGASGTPSLDDAALAAARRWRFVPEVRNGRPIVVEKHVSFEFELVQS